MNWSRRHGQPPGLRHLPQDDQPPRPAPLLTQPFAAGMTGWIVIFVAVIAELAGGAVVANQTSEAIAIAVLITPVVVVSRAGEPSRPRSPAASSLPGS